MSSLHRTLSRRIERAGFSTIEALGEARAEAARAIEALCCHFEALGEARAEAARAIEALGEHFERVERDK